MINNIERILDEQQSISILSNDVIASIYLLKAWKKLSDNHMIQEDSLKFDAFYKQKIEVKKFLTLLTQLSKEQQLFELYTRHIDVHNSIENEDLTILMNYVQNVKELPTVNDAFFSGRGKYEGFSVSNQIAQLGVELLNSQSDAIYVPFTNGFAYAYYTNQKIYAEYNYPFNALIAELANIIDNCNIEFHIADALFDPSFINKDAPHLLQEFESILSFPPFGLKGHKVLSKDKFNRFKIHRGSIFDVAHFEHILTQTKNKAVVLMPVGFTYRSGVEEEFRKYLIDNNYLEAIVQLPPNLHSATSIETTFFIISKQKENTNVHFINLKDEKFLKKEGRKIVFNNINELVDIYRKSQELENISALVDNSMIEKFNYSLAIDRYVISKQAAELEKQLDEYNLVALQEIAEIRRSQLFKDEGEGEEVYELSPSDLAKSGFTIESGKSKQIGSQYNKYLTYKLQPYDVLLSTKGTIGKVGIVGEVTKPMIASQAIQVIRIKDVENVKDKAIELCMFFKSDLGQSILSQLVAGVAMPQIATAEIKQLKVPVLSSNERNRVILNFNHEVEMYNQIKKLQADIAQLHSSFLGKNNGN
ncbi:N-6 DNA methylase [Candidatus Woesearchaeota archaeon]|nr:N-6 DNA methylase [Candidatus Woesearchaeota archaeon]